MLRICVSWTTLLMRSMRLSERATIGYFCNVAGSFFVFANRTWTVDKRLNSLKNGAPTAVVNILWIDNLLFNWGYEQRHRVNEKNCVGAIQRRTNTWIQTWDAVFGNNMTVLEAGGDHDEMDLLTEREKNVFRLFEEQFPTPKIRNGLEKLIL